MVSLGDTAVITSVQLKFQVPSPDQILIFSWGILQTNIPEILEWGHSRNLEPKILEA